MTKIGSILLSILLTLNFSACSGNPQDAASSNRNSVIAQILGISSEQKENVSLNTTVRFSLESVPAYSDAPFAVVNENKPFFTDEEISKSSFERYSPLDNLGRCGECIASIGPDIMPTEERGAIGSVKPSGWHSVKYDNVDGKYLYNRCHLIGYQLTGENANEENLITGTRYLNTEGMLPFENLVADYVKETKNHVMYRATPIFEGDNLLAHGVLLEGYSVEDNGAGVLFCVYCYNVQPGIKIDYADGTSESDSTKSTATTDVTYVLNTNTKRFHKPTCSSADKISAENRQETSKTKEQLLSENYNPCGSCKP